MHSTISKLEPATFEEFEREAARGNVVAVVRVVPEDSRSPVQAFIDVAGSARYAFLLESVDVRGSVRATERCDTSGGCVLSCAGGCEWCASSVPMRA